MSLLRAVLTIALLAVGCSSRHGNQAPPAVKPPAIDAPGVPTPPAHVVMDPVAQPAGCTLGHNGLLLDLGEPNARAELGIREPGALIERDGASWERVMSRTLSLRFLLPSMGLGVAAVEGAKREVSVDARIRGLSARSATVYLDGKVVGTWPLTKGEVRVVSARSSSATMPAAPSQLMIRFNGVPRTSVEGVAEIDWIRVGPGPIASSYSAPTWIDAAASQAVGGQVKRALSVPTPGFLRCIGAFPKGASIEFSAATAGRGDATVALRIARDNAGAVELASVTATASSWQLLRLPIPDAAAGKINALEIEVTSTSPSVRVLLGDLRVVAPPSITSDAMPAARNAVVVVLGDTPASTLSVYGGTLATPSLAALAQRGVVYERHRATSTWAAGSFGSALTGLLPPRHGAEDDAQRLGTDALTLPRAARDAGISAAMFTANPTTGAAYGFDRDWVDFESILPTPEVPATKIFESAAAWIDKHKAERFVVVVHARGGHPPWDVGGDQLKDLPPEGYTGAIDPRHAAEVLSKARRVPPLVRLTEPDRVRAMALFRVAVGDHDAALGVFLRALHDAGREGDTAVFVTGDVGVSSHARVPFGDDGGPDESVLSVPLVVFHPALGPRAGTRSQAFTSTLDLARSVVAALGLKPPHAFGGADILSLAASAEDRLLAATSARGRVSVRQGLLLLAGTSERASLCDLAGDPACANDASSAFPLAASVLRTKLVELAQLPAARPGYVVPDAALTSALRVWGR